MNKKKIGIISIICLVLIILLVVIVIIINKNNNKVTYNDGQTYKVNVKLPKKTEDNSKYTLVENKDENSEGKLNNLFADFAIVGDKVNIEFEKKTYTFQEIHEYIEKYGNEEGNFENFKKYIKDIEINKDLYTNIKELELNGAEAIQYTYSNTIIIALNIENIEKESYISIRIYPKDKNQAVSTLLEDEEIQEILNNIKFSKF